jgi:hypothetical protein
VSFLTTTLAFFTTELAFFTTELAFFTTELTKENGGPRSYLRLSVNSRLPLGLGWRERRAQVGGEW